MCVTVVYYLSLSFSITKKNTEQKLLKKLYEYQKLIEN